MEFINEPEYDDIKMEKQILKFDKMNIEFEGYQLFIHELYKCPCHSKSELNQRRPEPIVHHSAKPKEASLRLQATGDKS